MLTSLKAHPPPCAITSLKGSIPEEFANCATSAQSGRAGRRGTSVFATSSALSIFTGGGGPPPYHFGPLKEGIRGSLEQFKMLLMRFVSQHGIFAPEGRKLGGRNRLLRQPGSSIWKAAVAPLAFKVPYPP